MSTPNETKRMLDDRLLEGLRVHAEVVRDTLEVARRTCVVCSHFSDRTECCELIKPPMRPPARVIAFGCDSFDLLPF